MWETTLILFDAHKYLFTKCLAAHPQDIMYNQLISLPIKFNQKNLMQSTIIKLIISFGLRVMHE
ncbi:bifunctional penicillin-binding protein 1C [Rickettsia canadensis str. CA410]|uniref:Bifunctional penicillin-binding protein 1C n=1 Tax=Rickettsia canadensis str. CA410 TaxID=1105107 RepID=A0ABM5MQY5_RICCA|nr:hypothetical protein [Rickettsia canadensis]AFB20773.1 bifunctional penicillin-binding protein 1C [Rickettsia canadensis str. CA410]